MKDRAIGGQMEEVPKLRVAADSLRSQGVPELGVGVIVFLVAGTLGQHSDRGHNALSLKGQ